MKQYFLSGGSSISHMALVDTLSQLLSYNGQQEFISPQPDKKYMCMVQRESSTHLSFTFQLQSMEVNIANSDLYQELQNYQHEISQPTSDLVRVDVYV